MRITSKKINRYYCKATKGNVIQSVRRLIFTHCSNSMEELGHYYADMVYSMGGTGILLKFQQIFFLLTAKHVLDANYSEQQNESPFFTYVFSKGNQNDFEDHLFPMRGWRIGELIKKDIHGIEMDDLLLVELSSGIMRYPDKFIDFDSPLAPKGINPKDMYEGMYLIASGYPVKHNPIEYHFDEDYNCSATINKHIYPGVVTFSHGVPVMELLEQKNHAAINGMSGGMVSNLTSKSNQTEWVGMIQRAGNGIIRFYLADLIIPAIKNYTKASHFIIDPAVNLGDLTIELSQEAINGRAEYFKLVRQRTEKVKQQAHKLQTGV